MLTKFFALWHRENGKIILGSLLAVVAILFTPAGEIVERLPAIVWMIALIITLSFVIEAWRAPKQVTSCAPPQRREFLDDWNGKTDGRASWDPGDYASPKLILSDNGHAPEEGQKTFCPLCETMYVQPGFCGNLDCKGFSRQRLLSHYPPKDPSWSN